MRSSNTDANIENKQQSQMPATQDLQLKLKPMMHSDQVATKEMLLPKHENGSSASEICPLSERHMSNFDNQNNVKISNQKFNSSFGDSSTKPQQLDLMDGKQPLESETPKASSNQGELTITNDSFQEEDGPLNQKCDSSTNSKAIQKPQQKRKLEKSKNKLIDKENILVEKTKAADEHSPQTVSISLAKQDENSFSAESDKENNDCQTVSPVQPTADDVQIQNVNIKCPENNSKNEFENNDSFQQTYSTEQSYESAISQIKKLDDQITSALEQIKKDEDASNQITEVARITEQDNNNPTYKINEQIQAQRPLWTTSVQQNDQKKNEWNDLDQQTNFDTPLKQTSKGINLDEISYTNFNEITKELDPTKKVKSQTVVVDKDASPDLGLKKKVMDQHQISELTDSIVDDLIKNAFRPEPVQIEKDQQESEEEESSAIDKEFLENTEEEDNLNLRESFKNQELSKEEAKNIKSPVKTRPCDKLSSDGEQSQDEEEFIELGYQDISKVLFIDTKVMNFGTFMPGGKLLGSNLMIQNITKSEQIIELSVDSSSFRYKIEDLTQLFPSIMNNKKKVPPQEVNGKETSSTTAPVIPFEIENLKQSDNQSKSNFIKNSEYIHEAWFIENPVSRELTKRITLKLGPMAQQDFIIVNRSPIQVKRSENLLSIINVGLLTYKGEQFGVKHSFDNFLKYHYNNDMKLFLADRKELSQIQRMKVLLAGKVQVPKIACMKEIFLEEHGLRVMPLAVKKGFQQQIQRFKIPFKNTTPVDVEVEFQFMKTSAVINPASDQLPGAPQNTDENKVPIIKKGNMMQSLMASPIELSTQPSSLKIHANSQVILNISARLKNSYLLQQKELEQSSTLTEKQKQKTLKAMAKERFNHLLIARVKDTNMMFSYLFQAQLVQQEPAAVPLNAGQQIRQMIAGKTTGDNA